MESVENVMALVDTSDEEAFFKTLELFSKQDMEVLLAEMNDTIDNGMNATNDNNATNDKNAEEMVDACDTFETHDFTTDQGVLTFLIKEQKRFILEKN